MHARQKEGRKGGRGREREGGSGKARMDREVTAFISAAEGGVWPFIFDAHPMNGKRCCAFI